MAGRFWREAATLILVGKLPQVRRLESIKPLYRMDKATEYGILFLKRSATSSFMPGTLVFPGGAVDKADLDPIWLSIFKQYGYSEEEFVTSFRFPTNRLEIYTNKSSTDLMPELAFRICALRETFEETGLLLASSKKESTQSFSSLFPLERKELKRWRKLVHNDASEFISLIQHLNVCPSVQNLNEWSNWLTPTSFKGLKRRFDTAFYITFIDSEIPLYDHDNKEAEELKVEEPLELLQAFGEDKVVITPPQLYEIHRLLNFSSLNELKKFCEARASKGIARWMPVFAKTKNGNVSILPGDDLYPQSPDYFGEEKAGVSVESLEKSPTAGKRLHRIELKKSVPPTIIVKDLVQQNGHLNPLSTFQLSNDN